MKKTFLSFFLSLCASLSFAQSPFTIYTPADNYPSNPHYNQPQQTQPRLQRITGYYVKNGDFQRINIKVNVVETYSGENVYVRQYQDIYQSNWVGCNNQAVSINQHSNDPDVIKRNFDWKCYIMNIGWVYF